METSSLPTRFDEMNSAEVDQIMRMMCSTSQDAQEDGGVSAGYVNALAQGSLMLQSAGYGPLMTCVPQNPLQSRISVWGQGTAKHNNGYSSPPVTVWGGGTWGGEGVLYELNSGQPSESAVWVTNGANFSDSWETSSFSGPSVKEGPKRNSNSGCTPEGTIFQCLPQPQELKGMDITVAQLETLDQVVNDSSSHHPSLTYAQDPTEASKRQLGALGRGLERGANPDFDLCAKSYSLDTINPLTSLASPNCFPPQTMQQLESGNRVEQKPAGSSANNLRSHETVLERLGNYNLTISEGTSPSSQDSTYPDTSPTAARITSSHPLPMNSFQRSGHEQRLTAYYGNGCIQDLPRVQDQQQATTEPSRDITDMACLLSDHCMADQTSADPSNFTFSSQHHWGSHEVATETPPRNSEQNCELDLIEFVSKPLESAGYAGKVKTCSTHEVNSFECTVPRVWGDGQRIQGIEYHGHNTSLAEAKLRGICSQMRSQWQLGCIALAHR